jgi:hypothetical protein
VEGCAGKEEVIDEALGKFRRTLADGTKVEVEHI